MAPFHPAVFTTNISPIMEFLTQGSLSWQESMFYTALALPRELSRHRCPWRCCADHAGLTVYTPLLWGCSCSFCKRPGSFRGKGQR